ncbi:hypothetical protein RI054_06g32680 [Pseudoscourfieldia marina]
MAAMSLPLTNFAGKFQFPLKWLSGSKYNLVGNDLRAGLLPFPCSSFSKSTRKREVHFSVQPCSNLSAYASHSDYGIKVASFVSNDYLCANNGIGITTIRASISTSIHISSRTFADVSAPDKPNRRAVNQKARREFRSFEDARAYVRELGLKSYKEWSAWSASGERPYDIPGHPQTYYASSGWTSYGDFLGFAVGNVAGEFRSFEEARAYVHTLGLMSSTEWDAWSASGARPYDIPGNPQTYYASSGWLSFPDFLGYAVGKEAQVRQRTDFRSFEDARAYVHTLGLKGTEEWDAWSASGARPYDIPSHPDTYYASSGWMSYGDFLGYAVGKVAGSYRSFEDARAYVHTLGLMSSTEWEAWSASGARPYDIPSSPHMYYASSGWLSYGDFLGYKIGKVAGEFRSFEEARAYVHTLGLKSQEEWNAWRASGARPYDIPSHPDQKYASSGWLSYGDFVGYAVGKKARSLIQ